VNEVREAGGDARTLRLYGQEVNQTTAAIARMNLYLHDIETFRIARGDTLREPKLLDGDGALQRFDMIVANPPFSLKSWGRDGWAEDPHGRSATGVPPASYGDLAFVQHMVATMNRSSGRLALVMPRGVLFRGGAEQAIRQELLESGVVEAVIGLAPNLFYNTTIPACILVCRREMATDRRGHVLLVDGTARFEKTRSQNVLRPEDVEALLTAYFADDGDPLPEHVHARLVPLGEIEGNDWDLSLSRYVVEEAEAEVELTTAVDSYLEARAAQRLAEEDLDARLMELGLTGA
jgi:type I restriction enzyme M protein